jgi:hypothetical protein
MGEGKEGKGFFFEKKNQKTFATAVAPSPASRRQRAKFLLLYSKRSAFFLRPPPQ